MLLYEVAPAFHPVYHITTVTKAIQILTSQVFKLAGGPHINPEHDYEDPTQKYHMSVARSPLSDFIQMMTSRGTVMLVINKSKLQQHSKIIPYQSANASLEGWSDEMEDRIYNDTPILRVRPPINQTIVQVRLLGTPYLVYKATASFTQEQADELKALCTKYNIPFGQWANGDDASFLRGR